MQDVFTKERQAWLSGTRRSAPNDKARMQAKFDAAREAMGDKYCCHPLHHVQRVDTLARSWAAFRPSAKVQAALDRASEKFAEIRLFPRGPL